MSNIYFDPLIERICQAARSRLRNSDDGLVIISLKVVIGADNRPVMWSEPDCVKLEPAKKAAAFLAGMGR